MTQAEAEISCKKLTDLNLAFWNETSYAKKKILNGEFVALFKKISHAGYKIYRSKRVDDTHHRIPVFTPKYRRHQEVFSYVDVRPAGCTLENDCTTRCLTYCLNEDYWKIRHEQDAISIGKYGTPQCWNYDTVWVEPLFARGWIKITLEKRIARFNLAKLLKDIDLPIASHSSGHVAVVHYGKIVDTWHSEGGRVDYLVVPPSVSREVWSRIRMRPKLMAA